MGTMNSADIVSIAVMVICAGLGIVLGFTRGLFGFLGVYFAAQFAFKLADPAAGGTSGKCMGIFLGIFVGALIAGFLFYGSTRFTPIDAMDPVFGAIFGFLIGWGILYFTFHYYLVFKNESNFALQIWQGRIAIAVHDIAPYSKFMGKMEPLRHPHIE